MCGDEGPSGDDLPLCEVFADRARRSVLATARRDPEPVIHRARRPARDRVVPTPRETVKARSEQHDRTVQDGNQAEQEAGEAAAHHSPMSASRRVERKRLSTPLGWLCVGHPGSG